VQKSPIISGSFAKRDLQLKALSLVALLRKETCDLRPPCRVTETCDLRPPCRVTETCDLRPPCRVTPVSKERVDRVSELLLQFARENPHSKETRESLFARDSRVSFRDSRVSFRDSRILQRFASLFSRLASLFSRLASLFSRLASLFSRLASLFPLERNSRVSFGESLSTRKKLASLFRATRKKRP